MENIITSTMYIETFWKVSSIDRLMYQKEYDR